MEASVRVVQALARLKGPFLETPDMQLSLSDAINIAGVDQDICHLLLAALVDARFLIRGSDGAYRRQAHCTIES
jgi:hypothetical protein